MGREGELRGGEGKRRRKNGRKGNMRREEDRREKITF